MKVKLLGGRGIQSLDFESSNMLIIYVVPMGKHNPDLRSMLAKVPREDQVNWRLTFKLTSFGDQLP